MQYLQAAVQALNSGSTGAVQVGACRAIASLVPRAPRPALQPYLDPIFEGASEAFFHIGYDDPCPVHHPNHPPPRY